MKYIFIVYINMKYIYWKLWEIWLMILKFSRKGYKRKIAHSWKLNLGKYIFTSDVLLLDGLLWQQAVHVSTFRSTVFPDFFYWPSRWKQLALKRIVIDTINIVIILELIIYFCNKRFSVSSLCVCLSFSFMCMDIIQRHTWLLLQYSEHKGNKEILDVNQQTNE